MRTVEDEGTNDDESMECIGRELSAIEHQLSALAASSSFSPQSQKEPLSPVARANPQYQQQQTPVLASSPPPRLQKSPSEADASAFFRGLLSPRKPSLTQSGGAAAASTATDRLRIVLQRGAGRCAEDREYAALARAAREAAAEWATEDERRARRIADLEEELGTCMAKLAAASSSATTSTSSPDHRS
jgi:hypothetical protein